jgi:2',3'-cyclic-nucleotide 2'-phosphodiesterase
MRILFIGDIVGAPGVGFLQRAMPLLIPRERIDLVVANAENAVNGSGLTPSVYRKLRHAGIDLITLGDHVYKKAEIIPTMEKEERLCKPANFPPDAPGAEFAVATARNGVRAAALCVLGRTFMRSVDCPFRAADRVLAQLEGHTKVVIVDAHAEATADKYLLGHYLQGRVSAVLGTHTHVPTADEQILPGGTAFICDVGMTGPYDSILGRRIDRVLKTTVTFIPTPFDVAENDVRLGGAIVEVDSETGHGTAIRRFMLDEKGLADLETEQAKARTTDATAVQLSPP